MEIIDSKNDYKAPTAKVVRVNVQGVLCSSMDGSFGLSDGNVERGDDSDWGENLNW